MRKAKEPTERTNARHAKIDTQVDGRARRTRTKEDEAHQRRPGWDQAWGAWRLSTADGEVTNSGTWPSCSGRRSSRFLPRANKPLEFSGQHVLYFPFLSTPLISRPPNVAHIFPISMAEQTHSRKAPKYDWNSLRSRLIIYGP